MWTKVTKEEKLYEYCSSNCHFEDADTRENLGTKAKGYLEKYDANGELRGCPYISFSKIILINDETGEIINNG